MRGIQTVEELRERCRVDEDTGCWQFGKASRSSHAPGVRVAALGGEMVSLGVAAAVLRTGERPKAGVVWHITCCTKHCANPEHRKAGTRKSQMKQASYKPTALTLAKIAATKRAKSVLTPADIAEIRASRETLHELSARFGVSPSNIGRIRLNQLWRDTAAPAASVFSWGGA